MRHAIVTCVTADWIPGAAVTLLSAFENGGASDADLLIFAHGASAEDHRKLAEFNAAHGLAIRLVDKDASAITKASLGKWGHGAIMRLKLDQYLAADYERVLYLDSDVLVLAPLHTLLFMDMQGRTAAAAPDVGFLDFVTPQSQRHLEGLGIGGQGEYFNSGVMLFDWQKTLAGNVLGEALALLETRHNLKSPDQDALNVVLRGRWLHLSHRWNAASIERTYLNLDPFIVHFTGRKPWTVRRSSRDQRYFAYYERGLGRLSWSGFASRRRGFQAMLSDAKAWALAAVHVRRRHMLRQYLLFH